MVNLVFDDKTKDSSIRIKQGIGQVLLIIIIVVLLVFCLVKWGDQMQIIIINFMVALLGVLLAIEAMLYAYKRIDHVTRYDTSGQLERGNQAVGLMVGGLFIGLGFVIGLVIGMGVN